MLGWPEDRAVRDAARRWALEQLQRDPRVRRVGYFGSYALGREGVGSDLDIVVVMVACDEPRARRALLFETTSLPVPVDLLVHSEAEMEELQAAELQAAGGRFAEELQERAVWFPA